MQVCAQAVLMHGLVDRSKRDICLYIQVNVKKFKLLNRTLRRAEQCGPAQVTSRTLNQLYADPNNGSAMCIYVPNGESLNAMRISAQICSHKAA